MAEERFESLETERKRLQSLLHAEEPGNLPGLDKIQKQNPKMESSKKKSSSSVISAIYSHNERLTVICYSPFAGESLGKLHFFCLRFL